MIRPEFLEVAQRSFGKVDNGLMTVGELVIVECDEVLTDDELDEVASDFAGDYYETYLDDYAELFPEVAEVYAVRDKADSRSRVQNLLDARFEEWRLSRQSSQEEAT